MEMYHHSELDNNESANLKQSQLLHSLKSKNIFPRMVDPVETQNSSFFKFCA